MTILDWNLIEEIINKIVTNKDFKSSSSLARVLNDVVQAEQVKGNFAYLYLNETPVKAITLIIVFLTLVENLLDNGVVDPEELADNTQLLYTSDGDKTQSVIFKGSSGDDAWVLETVNKRGPNKSLKYIVTTQAFKTRVTISKGISTRSKQDIRKQFAESIGLSHFSRTDEKKSLSY